MELFYQTAACLCVTAMLAGVVGFLLPKSAVAKTVQLVLRLFFLASLIGCLAGVDLDAVTLSGFSAASSASAEMTELVEQQLLTAFRQNMEDTVSSILAQRGISASVEVGVHISAENIISINNIVIHGAVPIEVQQQIQLAVGLWPEVTG